MGLDMYLYKKTNSMIDNDESENIEDGDEIYYWRKANMIHNWFLRNGGLDEDFNCNMPPLIIDKELAERLLSELAIVNSDHDKAEELFPTASGFFWGYTLYDEWYYDTLEDTFNGLTNKYNNTDWKNEHWEYSCWW